MMFRHYESISLYCVLSSDIRHKRYYGPAVSSQPNISLFSKNKMYGEHFRNSGLIAMHFSEAYNGIFH
jgi:hypothetical protein